MSSNTHPNLPVSLPTNPLNTCLHGGKCNMRRLHVDEHHHSPQPLIPAPSPCSQTLSIFVCMAVSATCVCCRWICSKRPSYALSSCPHTAFYDTCLISSLPTNPLRYMAASAAFVGCRWMSSKRPSCAWTSPSATTSSPRASKSQRTPRSRS